VDKGIKYVTGQVVPGTGAATGWLAGALASRAECPNPNTAAPEAAGSDGEVEATTICTVSQLLEIDGVTAVDILDEANGAAHVTTDREIVVPDGWSVDREGVKYLPGDTLPSGLATWWAPECGKPLQ
jgi:hypothetical protein